MLPHPQIPIPESWGDFFGATNDAVQAAAPLVAGSFAYVKYIRGRTHYASLSLDLDALIVEVHGRKCMRESIKIIDSGTHHAFFNELCVQQIAIRCPVTIDTLERTGAGRSRADHTVRRV